MPPPLGEFTSNVQHVSGKSNLVADALSRLHPPSPPAVQSVSIVPPSLYTSVTPDLPSVAAAQKVDEELQKFAKDYSGDKLLSKYQIVRTFFSVR